MKCAISSRPTARLDSPIGAIPEVGAHLLQAGGKRLRPLLRPFSRRALTGAPIDLAIAVGCAAGLIHTATLYHDDVVDDGRVRRGRPAARMVYGNGIVVLVGDFCLARALETMASTGSLAAVQSLATTVTEMAEGEVAQLERAGNPDSSVDDYFRVIDRKTASLFAWCARVAGGVGLDFDAGLDRYGRSLGRAFQIADDVLDCDIDEATAGKSVGHDIQEGKLTLPVLYACETSSALRTLVSAKVGEARRLRGRRPSNPGGDTRGRRGRTGTTEGARADDDRDRRAQGSSAFTLSRRAGGPGQGFRRQELLNDRSRCRGQSARGQ